MARFTYKCEDCGRTFKVSLARREPTQPCPHDASGGNLSQFSPHYEECGGTGKPVFAVGSTKIMERLDNGAMPRAVERIHNIEEITAADADAHSAVPEDDDA